MTSTKEQLLAGGKPRPFRFSTEESGEVEVMLQPLAAPEAEEVQAALMAPYHTTQRRTAGQPVDDEDDEDAPRVGRAKRRGGWQAEQESTVEQAEVMRAFYRSCALATAYGLVDPAMTLEEVQAWRNVPAVEQIGQEVTARSGLGKDQRAELRRFRDKLGGPGDAGAAPEREPAGADPG